MLSAGSCSRPTPCTATPHLRTFSFQVGEAMASNMPFLPAAHLAPHMGPLGSSLKCEAELWLWCSKWRQVPALEKCPWSGSQWIIDIEHESLSVRAGVRQRIGKQILSNVTHTCSLWGASHTQAGGDMVSSLGAIQWVSWKMTQAFNFCDHWAHTVLGEGWGF